MKKDEQNSQKLQFDLDDPQIDWVYQTTLRQSTLPISMVISFSSQANKSQ